MYGQLSKGSEALAVVEDWGPLPKKQGSILNGSPEQKNENRTALPVREGSPAGAPFWVLYKSAALLQN